MKRTYSCAIIVAFSFFITVFFSVPTMADDFDDKIGKYTDDDIQSDHQMGEFNPNITFKKLDAKSKAKVREKANTRKNPDGTSSSSSSSSGSKSKTNIADGKGSSNVNSVVLGAGSEVKGDIIILGK